MNNYETVKNIIRDKCRSGEVFTSVDITKTAVNIQHREVRECLHKLFDSGEFNEFDYTRTTMKMETNQDAFVYHPNHIPATYYANRNQTLDGRGADFNVPTPPSNTRLLRRGIRADGAVELPSSLVKKLHPKADALFAYIDGDKVVVTADQNNAYTRFIVYKNGEARIPKKIIDKCFSGNTAFKINVSHGELHIRAD